MTWLLAFIVGVWAIVGFAVFLKHHDKIEGMAKLPKWKQLLSVLFFGPIFWLLGILLFSYYAWNCIYKKLWPTVVVDKDEKSGDKE